MYLGFSSLFQFELNVFGVSVAFLYFHTACNLKLLYHALFCVCVGVCDVAWYCELLTLIEFDFKVM